ncbi:GtrA family protein [Pseudomonas sp. P5_A2_2]
MRHFLKFSLVGALGFIVDAGVLSLLVGRFEVNVYVARIISFFVAVLATWLANRSFTFKHQRRIEISNHEEYLRYFAVQTVGAGINFLVFFLAIQVMPMWRSFPVIPLAIGSVVALVFNYLAARRFVFSTFSRS